MHLNGLRQHIPDRALSSLKQRPFLMQEVEMRRSVIKTKSAANAAYSPDHRDALTRVRPFMLEPLVFKLRS